MLFSREEVANFINQNFESAWEMLRPVPIVRIDFGNGNVSTRTLHGNVASYVCGTDGQVVDILPGIYTPAAYTAALVQPRALAVSTAERADRLAQLQAYHGERARQLRIPQRRPVANVAVNPRVDVGKGRIEGNTERQMAQARLAAAIAAQRASARPRSAADLAAWAPLLEDTARNENERRLLIHDHLARAGAIRPEQIKRWLYRDVLHADLDDPHMGLGGDFFAGLE